MVKNLHNLVSLLLLVTWLIPAAGTETDALSAVGAHPTTGAAAGYVDDAVCGTCHADRYQSYQKVGMSQSFKRPKTAIKMENFGREYYYEPLQRYYQIVEQGEDLIFRRYQKDKNGDLINEVEIPIAWVLGSGNRARSYIYQTDWGEMFMLPINWYSEDQRWGMSPGFEVGDNPGIHRQITRDCMFCHNAFPDVPADSDAHWANEIYPHNLPEGTGCQRCHGPGIEHIKSVVNGSDVAAIRSAITNPARLSAELRDSVCFQCHMLPSASLQGSRRIGEGVYSFRPGQLLSDYLVNVDIVERGERPQDRFEINHHGYRLLQSTCFRESMGELTCISCHDPHVKPESSSFRSDVGEICLGCHQNTAMKHQAETNFAGGICVTCHMPRRRTSDVIHVTMTDHKIARGPFDLEALIEPLEKENRVITSVSILELGDPPEGIEARAYRSLAALRGGRSIAGARNGLEQALKDLRLSSSDPYMDLAVAQFNSGHYSAAESTARKLIADGQNLPKAYAILGTSMLAQGQADQAAHLLKNSIELQPHPETHFSLAAVYIGKGDYRQAEEQIEAAIKLRPHMPEPWKYKARLLAAKGELKQARDAFKRVLELKPLDLPVYKELIDLLRSLGEAEQADRYLELGMRMSRVRAEL